MGQWFVRAASVVAVVSLGLAGKWAVGCASGESDSAPVGQVRAALVLGDAGAGTPLLQTATAQRLSDRITQRCNVTLAPSDAGVPDAAADGVVALAAVAALDAGAPTLPGMPTASELAALVAEAGA